MTGTGEGQEADLLRRVLQGAQILIVLLQDFQGLVGGLLPFGLSFAVGVLLRTGRLTTATRVSNCNHATPHLLLPLGFLQEVLHRIHGLLEALPFIYFDHLVLVGVIRLQLFHFNPGTGWKHDTNSGQAQQRQRESKQLRVRTYWSSVPKNFTKWHFLPLGFFRSLGGLTI